MNRALKKRTETALDELAKTYGLVRGLMLQRLEEIDTRAVRKRGSAYASKVAQRIDDIDTRALQRRGFRSAAALRKSVERRARPRPRGRQRMPVVGLLVLGAGVATVSWLLYDRSRRERMRRRLEDAQNVARERYSDLGGVTGALGKVTGRTNGGWQEPNLKTRVESAIAEGGSPPPGLEVSVEGRTVYLRGQVDDPSFVDAAAERIHAVDGVVAVVNLTTGPAATANRS